MAREVHQGASVGTQTMDETVAPYTTATWEFPPCLRCGGECIFTDGICAPCWRVYQEEIA